MDLSKDGSPFPEEDMKRCLSMCTFLSLNEALSLSKRSFCSRITIIMINVTMIGMIMVTMIGTIMIMDTTLADMEDIAMVDMESRTMVGVIDAGISGMVVVVTEITFIEAEGVALFLKRQSHTNKLMRHKLTIDLSMLS
ncbi:hypothetical protein E3N88_34471 [Mikania micrantha]|uniref:Uncharacterized protein n=1 Tax=Mikania micrantha TaxID=192012 RepID=A0A5N6LYH3_9ASTR|nr:hypothetical protein E3N88_34471 [Mikania micrantha]